MKRIRELWWLFLIILILCAVILLPMNAEPTRYFIVETSDINIIQQIADDKFLTVETITYSGETYIVQGNLNVVWKADKDIPLNHLKDILLDSGKYVILD